MITEKSKANLIPSNQRSPSEAREMARKGGINSGITRREKKTLKETVKTLLDLPLSNEDKKKISETLKLTGKLTQREAVAFALLTEARKGKPQQARLVLELDDSIGSNVQQGTNTAPTITYVLRNETLQAMQTLKERKRKERERERYLTNDNGEAETTNEEKKTHSQKSV